MRRRTRGWRRRNRIIYPRPLRFSTSFVVPRSPLPAPTPVHAVSTIAVYLRRRWVVAMMIHVVVDDGHRSGKLLGVRDGREGTRAGTGLALSNVFSDTDFDALIGKGARQRR